MFDKTKKWLLKISKSGFAVKYAPAIKKIIPEQFVGSLKKSVSIDKNIIRIPYTPSTYPEGVNFFGYLKAQMGLGQGSRLYAKTLQGSNLPCNFLNICIGNPSKHNDTEFYGKLTKHPTYNTNIIHVNADQMNNLQLVYSQNTWDRRYNIGVWLWELEQFPSEWHDAFRYVDEIWTPSTFITDCIRAVSPVPVHTIPYGIEAQIDATMDRAYFQLLENQFLFLCMYDVNSVMARKNPLGAISAFMKAFPSTLSDVGLVVKINNGNDKELSKIREYTKGYSNIYIIDKTMSKTEVNSLIHTCDTFVSLHRSEGFGLSIAEAMYLGIPTIATNWSANTDFMKKDNSCLVDFDFIDVGNHYFYSKQGQRWADPNLDHAATYMNRLYDDSAFRDNIAQNGQKFITKQFSLEASAEKMIARLQKIGTISYK